MHNHPHQMKGQAELEEALRRNAVRSRRARIRSVGLAAAHSDAERDRLMRFVDCPSGSIPALKRRLKALIEARARGHWHYHGGQHAAVCSALYCEMIRAKTQAHQLEAAE